MKKIIFFGVCIAVLVASLAYADEASLRNWLIPGKTDADKLHYLESTSSAQESRVTVIQKDKDAFANTQIDAIDKQTAWLEQQIKALQDRKAGILKDKKAFADNQIAALNVQITASKSRINTIKAGTASVTRMAPSR
jgi:hypothetical protein